MDFRLNALLRLHIDHLQGNRAFAAIVVNFHIPNHKRPKSRCFRRSKSFYGYRPNIAVDIDCCDLVIISGIR